MLRDHWEYKTVTVPLFNGKLKDKDVDDHLKPLGAEGWELLDVSTVLFESETLSIVDHVRRLVDKELNAGFSA